MHIDDTDEAILQALKNNSRLSLRKLAETVHMTAPSVAERVRRLEEQRIITRYTILIDQSKIAPVITAYINVFIKSNNSHHSFLQFVRSKEEIQECHRIAGDSCYLLKVTVVNQEALDALLDKLLGYGNYRLNTVVSSLIKDEA